MRFAAIADVHGNYLALEAVIADIRARGIDDIVNLGDMASGPLEARRTMDAFAPATGYAENETAGYRRPSGLNYCASRSDRSGDPLLQLLLRRRADLA